MKTFTIRMSNAAPAWPHELVIHDTFDDSTITYAMGHLDRLMWRLNGYYTEGDVIKLENIVCKVERAR